MDHDPRAAVAAGCHVSASEREAVRPQNLGTVPAIDAVKLQIRRGGVRLAMLIEAAAAGMLPAHLLKLTP